MFQKVNADEAVNSKGFKVKILGHGPCWKIQYSEADIVITFEMEGGVVSNGEVIFSIYTESFGSPKPFCDMPLVTLEKRDEIVNRVDEGLTFLGINHEMV